MLANPFSWNLRKMLSDRWMTYRRNKTVKMLLRAKRDHLISPDILSDIDKRTMYVCTSMDKTYSSLRDFGSFTVDHLKRIISRKIRGRASVAIVFYELVGHAIGETDEYFDDEFDICDGYAYYQGIYLSKDDAQSAYIQHVRSQFIDDLMHEVLLGYCDPVGFVYGRIPVYDFQQFLKPEYRFKEF